MTDYKVISGGQTGADQGGLEGARDAGVKTGGSAPMNYLTELGPEPALQQYGLTDSRLDYKGRTISNVRDSDVTLWFGNINSPGGKATAGACRQLNKKIIPITWQIPKDVFAMIVAGGWHTINVAGNRESHNRGIQASTRVFIRDLCLLLLQGTHTDIQCEYIGCNNPATHHFFNQWPTCSKHVDETEKMLRENVGESITRQPISTFSKEKHDQIISSHRPSSQKQQEQQG